MILVETKAESVASSPLGFINLKDEKPTLSFSELLRGVKTSKEEVGTQNESFVLDLGAEEKDIKTLKDVKLTSSKETLSSLLKGSNDKAVLSEEIKPFELNPKITQNLSVAEIKTLIADAKTFLKDKILQSVEYKKSEVKDLPKTLKGLAQMAKTFGINVSKITLEEVKSPLPASKLESKEIAKPLEVVKPLQAVEAKEIAKPLLAVEAKEVAKSLPAVEAKEIVKPLPVVEAKEIAKPLPVVEAKEIAKPLQAVEAKEIAKPLQVTQAKEMPTIDTQVEVKVKSTKVQPVKVQAEQDPAQEVKIKADTKEVVKENIRVDDKKLEVIKEIKSTPLFKAQEKVEHTTEQIVQTKQFKVEEKTPKSRADETLKLLLRGEKPTASNVGPTMTKDFSVATARVIAPSATTEVSKSVEQLLRGDVSEEVVKLDKTQTQDVESFEVKVKEAKQMMKYLSQDVKTAIEDYKSPFTRIKVQLNPAKMGEIDLTVVQRGKNLHINLTSNNVAINTLAMNVNDLKTQLTNNGIQNATFNFNDSSQNSEQQNSQQRNRQNEKQANEEYNYFDNEEQNEEIINSLEIVVPNYA